MKYVKERNFIVAYDGDVRRGKWDILTNQFYGVRGGIVKTRPVAFNDDTMRRYLYYLEEGTPISDVIYMLLNYFDTLTRAYGNERVGQRMEEVISVGLRLGHNSELFRTLATDDTVLNKECVEFLKENYSSVYASWTIEGYKTRQTYKDCFVHLTDDDDKDWVRGVIDEVDKSLPVDFVVGMVRRGVTEKVRMAHSSYSFSNLIKEWVLCLKGMEEEVKVYHNILTMYAIIQWRYNKYKQDNYDALLKKYNDKPFLYFEDDRYIARPLLSRADFHKEATRQENCVENSYMEYVARGETYIVGVRLKSDPEVPYLTCEVGTSGEIEQFRRRFNNSPDTQDREFQSKFQEFITNFLKQEKENEKENK